MFLLLYLLILNTLYKKIIKLVSLSLLFIACSDKSEREAQKMRAKQMTIDSIDAEQAKQRIIDSMKAVTAEREARAERRAADNTSGNSSTTEKTSSTTKKKGLNATSTGALIGAGAGAITGAMVDGKKGEGAIVGGLIGAAAGAGTGAIIDGKKKKKAASQTNQ